MVTTYSPTSDLALLGSELQSILTSLPNTPWYTRQHVVNRQDGKRVTEDGEEDETGHGDQADEDGVSVTETFRHETVDKQSDDFSDVCTLFNAGD